MCGGRVKVGVGMLGISLDPDTVNYSLDSGKAEEIPPQKTFRSADFDLRTS